MIVAPGILVFLALATLAGALFVPQPTLAAGSIIASAIFSAGAALCFAIDRLRRALGASSEHEKRAEQIRKEVS